MRDYMVAHKMTNKDLIVLARSEIEIFERPSARTSSDLVESLTNSTPNSEIQKIIDFYDGLNIDSYAVQLVIDAIVADLKKLIEVKE